MIDENRTYITPQQMAQSLEELRDEVKTLRRLLADIAKIAAGTSIATAALITILIATIV